MDADLKPHDGGRTWWREWELGLLLVLLAGMYLTNLDGITIRGEESRRGRIAWEMLECGNWVVPTMQDHPVFYRPPLQNALIATTALVHGKVDAWSLRIPSVIAILLMVSLIYGYGRSFLSKLGAFAAALGFASMGQVIELGRLGETEAVFTLFVAGSLLMWRWCMNAGTSLWVMWPASYALAALGTLTKGPQAPMYFVGGVWLFLLVTKRWRMLVSLPHLAGIATALGVLSVWQIPYAMEMGWPLSFKVYVGDVASRFGDMQATTVIKHLISFPLEILFGSLLPWSVLLLCYASGKFREDLGRLRENALFLALCIGISFPSVWIPATASLRYYMPMFPMFACLAGIAIERIAAYSPETKFATLFLRYQRALALIAGGTGAVILVASLIKPTLSWAQSIPFAAFFFVACLILSAIGWQAARQLSPRGIMIGMTATACFLGLTYSTQMVFVRQKISEDARGAIAQLREKLPHDQSLVSIGPAHHLFLLLYGEKVAQLPVDSAAMDQAGTDYFCFWVWSGGVQPKDIPFEWEQVAEISCDRNKRNNPVDNMIIGRRVRSKTAAAETSEPPMQDSVEDTVGKLLGRQMTDVKLVSHDGSPGKKRICFVGLENKSIEELGDFGEHIYEKIDTSINESDVFEIINRRYVQAALREKGLRPDDLFVKSKQRSFQAAMEEQSQPFDYLLFAKITSGTARSDYALTLELVDITSGNADKERADLRKGNHESAIGEIKHYK